MSYRSDIDLVFGIGRTFGKIATDHYRRGKAEAESERRTLAHHEHLRRIAEDYVNLVGSADWPSRETLATADLLTEIENLGRLAAPIALGGLEVPGAQASDLVWWNGSGHLLTIAPTRSGKGASQIVPTLLRYPGSCLVVDPKGENYDRTAGWRHLQGSRIFRLAPFDRQGRTDAFNPLDYVSSAAQARQIAEMLIPREATRGEGRFFEDEAINFLSGLIWYLVDREHSYQQTLGEVRRLTMPPAYPDKELLPLLKSMAEDEDDTIAGAGRLALFRIEGEARKYHKLLELFRSMDAKMAIWSEVGMQEATSRSDFNLEALKDDLITVYLEVPFEMMKSHGAFLRIFFTVATNAMLRRSEELDIPVLFLIDEFPSMGRVDILGESISYLYGFGVRVWLFAQTLHQLEAIYPDRWKDIMDGATVRTFMDARGMLAQLISQELHDTTVVYETLGSSEGMSQNYGGHDTASSGTSSGFSFVKRPLLTPDEVERYLCRKRPDHAKLGHSAMCFVDHLKFGVTRPYWFLDKDLSSMVERGKAHLASLPGKALHEAIGEEG